MTLDIGYCRIYIISSCFSFQSQSLRMLLRREAFIAIFILIHDWNLLQCLTFFILWQGQIFFFFLAWKILC